MLAPLNAALAEYGMPSLDVAYYGLATGPGAWDATAVAVLMLVAFGGCWLALRFLLSRVKIRVAPPHACGHDASREASRIPPEAIYPALVNLCTGNKPGSATCPLPELALSLCRAPAAVPRPERPHQQGASVMLDLLVGILHLVVFPGGLFALALGLFLKGYDRRVEARLQRRVGPPLIQPFLDLVKLSTKEVIIPTSAVRGAFLAAPVVALGGIAMCAALLPVPGVTDGLPKMGDLLVIFYLFPIPAMAIMLAGSSSGSPYGGIGFSREMIMMLAYEVPLLMIMLTVAMKVGGGSGAEFSLTKIMDYQAEHGSFGLTPVMWPAFLAWLMFLPATLGVPPFDQPEAETEILEGPLLEYSGVLLAFFHMASALKMVVALALGVVLFFPGTISDIPAVNLVWFVVKCALFMLFTLTVVKSATGRLRIEQALSFFLKYPAGLALLSLILVWIGC